MMRKGGKSILCYCDCIQLTTGKSLYIGSVKITELINLINHLRIIELTKNVDLFQQQPLYFNHMNKWFFFCILND